MAAVIILSVLIVAGIVAWYVFRNAEPSPRRMTEDFKKRRELGLVRDDTGHNPEQENRRFRWWSR